MRRAASEDSQLPLPSASAAEDARPAPDAARTVDASSPDAAKALKVGPTASARAHTADDTPEVLHQKLFWIVKGH